MIFVDIIDVVVKVEPLMLIKKIRALGDTYRHNVILMNSWYSSYLFENNFSSIKIIYFSYYNIIM